MKMNIVHVFITEAVLAANVSYSWQYGFLIQGLQVNADNSSR